MRNRLSLIVVLFLITLTITLNLARIGETDLLVQSTQAQTLLLAKTDFANESTAVLANTVYRRPSNYYSSISPTGARGVNIAWEGGQSNVWYIEEQRGGEDAIIAGIIKNDLQAIEAGFKMFDWGFARQAADGSFPGTSDAFHSTSFFVQAVARSLLFIQQSPQAQKYSAQINRYKPLVRRAAQWMISPNVWTNGVKNNIPFTHRRFLVAAALGLTGKLTGDQQLVSFSRTFISDGVALQLANGVMPEKGGYDSSYQMVGLMYAERWACHFPNDTVTPKVVAMINKGLAWEKGRILPSGEINAAGNTRTGVVTDVTRTGQIKLIDHRSVIRGFGYWASATVDRNLEAIALKIAGFYYK
jgi:hypothetical protein